MLKSLCKIKNIFEAVSQTLFGNLKRYSKLQVALVTCFACKSRQYAFKYGSHNWHTYSDGYKYKTKWST